MSFGRVRVILWRGLASVYRTQVGLGLLVAAVLIGGMVLSVCEGRFVLLLMFVGASALALLFYRFPSLAAVLMAFIIPSNVAAYVPHTTTPVLVMGIGAVVARKLLCGDFSFRTNSFLVWTLLFFAWEITSVAWAPSYDQFAAGTMVRNALVVLLVIWTVRTPAHFVAVSVAALVGVLFSTGMAIQEMIEFFRFGSQQVGSDVFRDVEKARFFGGWTDPNIMGLSAVPFVLLGYALVRTKIHVVIRWMAAGAILVGTAGILLSLSRGAMLALGLGAVVLVLADKRRWTVLLGAAISVAIVVTLTPLDVVGRLLSLRTGDSSVSQRAEMIVGGTQLAADFFPFGAGLGNAGTYSPDYCASLRHGVVLHNAFLDVLVETGIVGLVLFVGAYASVLAQFRVRRWQMHPDSFDVNLTICMLCAYLSVVVANVLGSYSNYLLIWFVLALISVRSTVFRESMQAAEHIAQGITVERSS